MYLYELTDFDLDDENIEYGDRIDSPNNFQEGQWFDISLENLDKRCLFLKLIKI